MKTNRMGWISVSCLLLGLSAPGYAALAYVDDTVLDGLRGRYVDAGKIVNFGIQMTTIWRDADGTLSGVATQLTGRDNGQVRVSNYTLDGKTAGNPSSLPTTPGLASVQGVVQVNQLAGTNNQSHNSATVEIDNAGAAPLALGTNWQPVSQSSANHRRWKILAGGNPERRGGLCRAIDRTRAADTVFQCARQQCGSRKLPAHSGFPQSRQSPQWQSAVQ
ncbi:hypothetical protein [Paludibacterium denitrificans]|uniref:Uncharacterized protein n=1 Tax=Paludibacterium denitrificans TaxID=2675226 RepID=A0A844GEF1_9NEIS|nr:hypothetical protein [Paludibacterium denitrificans]MTD33651.1 hypothetical protein [Paludibacterium denitrificans]